MLLVHFVSGQRRIQTKVTITLDGFNFDSANYNIRFSSAFQDDTIFSKRILPISKPKTRTIIVSSDLFNCNVYLYSGDSMINTTGTFIATGSHLKIWFPNKPIAGVVKGGENEFYQKNHFVYLAMPNYLMRDSKYYLKYPKRRDTLDAAYDMFYYLKYREHENNILALTKTNAKYFKNLRELYDEKGNLSTATLRKAYGFMPEKIRQTQTGIALKQYIDNASSLFLDARIPDLQVMDTNYQTVKLDSGFYSKHEYTFVDFWASWCAPCRAEIKKLSNDYDNIDTARLRIVAVNLDDLPWYWKKISATEGIKWMNVADTLGFKGRVVKDLNIDSIPDNFMMNAQGQIVEFGLHGDRLREFLLTNKLLTVVKEENK